MEITNDPDTAGAIGIKSGKLAHVGMSHSHRRKAKDNRDLERAQTKRSVPPEFIGES